jgi:hypothetical protein
MANGVHGRMDFTVPGGGVSDSSVVDLVVDGSGVGRWDGGMGRRVDGEMNRMLLRFSVGGFREVRKREDKEKGGRTAGVDLLVIQVEKELMVKAFYVLERRDDLLDVLVLQYTPRGQNNASSILFCARTFHGNRITGVD